MLFNSIEFAIFLPVVFAIYWLMPSKYRWTVLFVASYYFYMCWNVKYVVLILFTTVVSYLAGRMIEKTDSKAKKKLMLTATLVSCFGVLFVFKYFNFFSESLFNLLTSMSIRVNLRTLNLLLPVGISFYTFQTLSYVIDVYRGGSKAEKNLGVFATFVAFFPQLVAGPIERTNNLLPQIREEHKFNYEQATYGLKLMAWGFFKKMVVADNLAIFVDRVYNNMEIYKGFSLVLATVFFSVQIYCDFSGYSDIARGVSKLFGIELMENFRSPYFSGSVKEFWSRWHISLSTWFRDYLYIPLGGNRVGKFRHCLNLLITFLVSGLWHGANWTFVIWGGIHGIAQVLENLLHIKAKKKNWFVKLIAGCFVFAFAAFAWVFFRAQNFSDAMHVFTHMFSGITNPIAYLYNGFEAIGMSPGELAITVGFYFVPLGLFDYFSTKTDVIAWVSNRNKVLRHLIYVGIVMIVLFLHAIGEVSFVYFQF